MSDFVTIGYKLPILRYSKDIDKVILHLKRNKLNSVRHNKLIMIQLHALGFILHEKLRIVRLNKLMKERKLWQVHKKNWPNPLRP
jgi:hypothetical protein